MAWVCSYWILFRVAVLDTPSHLPDALGISSFGGTVSMEFTKGSVRWKQGTPPVAVDVSRRRAKWVEWLRPDEAYVGVAGVGSATRTLSPAPPATMTMVFVPWWLLAVASAVPWMLFFRSRTRKRRRGFPVGSGRSDQPG